MKKWNKPELLSLGVENTFEGVCDCGATTYKTAKNEHYCHRDNLWHRNNCTSLQQGHFQSGSNCPTGGITSGLGKHISQIVVAEQKI